MNETFVAQFSLNDLVDAMRIAGNLPRATLKVSGSNRAVKPKTRQTLGDKRGGQRGLPGPEHFPIISYSFIKQERQKPKGTKKTKPEGLLKRLKK